MSRKSRQPRQPPHPDEGLAPENFGGLNKTFYRAEPHAFLRQRWINLLAVRGNPDELGSLLAAGVTAGGLTYQDTGGEDGEDAERSRGHFVIAESELLLHHVGETLLRLYLAHADTPPCPWLELARVRSPTKFKKQVEGLRKRLVAGEERRRICHVFYGSDKRESFRPHPDEESWRTGADSITRYLDTYADNFLDSASYNATKHGLALNAGEAAMQLGDGKLIAAKGPSLAYLAVQEQDGRSRWVQETKWINVDRSMTLSIMGSQLIEALWMIGRGRYVDRKIDDSIRLFDKPSFDEVDEVARKGEGPLLVEKMAMSLTYYKPEAA